MNHSFHEVSILGAGSWGTAVAIHLARSGKKVLLWARHEQHAQEMQLTRCNSRYLPGILFPESMDITSDLDRCIEQSMYVMIAVPSHAFTPLLDFIKQPIQGLSWLTKGLDPQSHHLLSEEVAIRWGTHFPIGIISGPSFAREVSQGLPTALVLASNRSDYQQAIHGILHHDQVRVYKSNDIVGVQWCGAVKNIIAIACGVSDGLSYGANAKAALITRGLSEMARIGLHLGGKQDTFMGLAGIGDLVLTCTDDQSRNRRFGLYLGNGATCHDAEQQIGQVVEGRHNAAQVCALATQLKIEMPICQNVYSLLRGEITAQEAAMHLMMRPPVQES